MNKNVSVKITHINFILILLIVFLHSNCLRFIEGTNIIVEKIYETISVICDSSVPAFFILSAYLYYRNYDKTKTKIKFKSRIHSLLIPYFLWSIIFLIYYKIISLIPMINDMFNNTFEFGLNNLLGNIIFAKCAEGMWFVRNLIIYTIFSPLIYEIMKKSKKINYIIIFVSLLINIYFRLNYSNPVFWLPIYLFGVNLGIFHKEFDNKVEIIKYSKLKLFVLIFLLLIIAIGVSYFKNDSLIYYLYRMTSPIITLSILDLFRLYRYNVIDIEKNSFFIYCIHLPIIKVIRKILFLIFGHNPTISFFIFFMTIIITLFIIRIIAKILKENAKTVFKLLTGERM